ncbi:MAG: putative dsRNA-binding protein [Patescibacteria group bacterium]|nr:putative dsRNA-binding protein [Patescibacteria group bacterium]
MGKTAKSVNYKAVFCDYLQKREKFCRYVTNIVKGTKSVYVAKLIIEKQVVATGTGFSVSEAEQNAAEKYYNDAMKIESDELQRAKNAKYQEYLASRERYDRIVGNKTGKPGSSNIDLEVLGTFQNLRRIKKERKIAYCRARSAKGQRNEEMVLKALSDPHYIYPKWFVSARLHDQDEDAMGIDIVVTTNDLGDLYLQVKSSYTGKRKFILRGRRRKLIGIVVVTRIDAEPEVLLKALQVCCDLRNEIMRRRENG